MGRRLPLWFSALFLFTACKTTLPLKPKGGNSGDARSGMATIVVEIDNEQVLKSELGDKLTGYRFVVQPLDGTVCATSSKIDRTEAWDVHDFREDLIANCDYRVGMEVGTLNADGTKLATVAYSNLDGTQRGHTILSSYLKPGTVFEVNFPLSKAVLTSGGDSSDAGKTPVPPAPDDQVVDRGREVMGYYVNGDSGTGNSLETLKTYHNHLSGMIPQWFNLKANGTVAPANGGINQESLNIANKELLKIVPFVFVDQASVAVLTDPLNRSTAVNNIVQMVTEQRFHGVNMFAARVAKEEKAMFTAFMDELAAKLHEEKKLLMLLVYPKTADVSLNGVYDYKALGEVVDRLIVMTYDRNYAVTSPGPVAPLPWVEENIQKLLQEDQVPPEKILLGLANYGYDWPASGAAKMISEKKAFETATQFKANFEWDDTAQVPFLKYADAGKNHTIYFENSYSASFKLDLVQKYDLKGVAIYQLGGETERFWAILKEVLKI